VDLPRLERGDNLLQSAFWGRLKSRQGQQARAFFYTCALGSGKLLVIEKPLGDGKTAAYLPWAPELSVLEAEQGSLLESLGQALRPYLPSNCLFIRFDLPWRSPYENAQGEPPEQRLREIRMNFGTCERNLRKAPTDVQPTDSIIIHTQASDEELLGRMRSKTRYNIRLSGRRGVEVYENGSDEIQNWLSLYAATRKRKQLTPHSENYFKRLFSLAESAQHGKADLRLLLAWHNGEVLAGMVLALYGTYALYLYGASGERKRNLMPTYRLQWRAIEIARETGCSTYDLFGIPSDTGPGHPMHGLLQFKTGFGGERIRRRGCWDYPLDQAAYETYRGHEIADGGYYRSFSHTQS